MTADPREIAQRADELAEKIRTSFQSGMRWDANSIASRKIAAILAAEMPRWVPGRAKEFWLMLPHCCGYPKCDGDLEGELHSGECPLYQKTEMTKFEFAEAYAKWLQETP